MDVLSFSKLSLVIVGLLTAGCIGEPSLEPAPTTGTATSLVPAATIPWGLSDCQFGVGIMGAEATKLAPYLPKGFRALSMQELANPSARDIKGDANIGVEGFVCKEGVGLNGTVAGMVYASVFTVVAPPAHLRHAGMGMYFVKWDVLIPDDDRRAALAEAGIPAREGTVSFTRQNQQGQLNAYEVKVRIDQLGDFTIQGVGFAPMDAGAFREYTDTPFGLANFTTKYKGSFAQGAASVTVPGSSWVAKVTGAGTFPAATFSGTGTFYDASIDLPARPRK